MKQTQRPSQKLTSDWLVLLLQTLISEVRTMIACRSESIALGQIDSGKSVQRS